RNGDDLDGCTDHCFESTCGNGEDDDPDRLIAGGGVARGCDVALEGDCDPNCTRPTCGNGIVGVDENGVVETCDDGNTISGDGCSAECQVEVGFACPGGGTNDPRNGGIIEFPYGGGPDAGAPD